MNPYPSQFKRARRALGASAVLLLIAVSSGLAAPEEPPVQLETRLPKAIPPAGMEVYQLQTGVTHRSAGFAYESGSFSDRRDFAMAATFVKHPRGDLLIDTGFGRDIDTHIQLMPAWFRWTTSYERWTSASEQLDKAGYDRRRLRGILLTHTHWDHVSGIPDFPSVPVLLTAEERAFIGTGGSLTAVMRSFSHVSLETYGFEGGPYLGFPRHHDVYGDGSIVVVPAPGHTPGSVIVFLALPAGTRYALLGDLVWQLEGITLLKERPWFARLGDEDPDRVRANLKHIAAISAQFPEMILVPAHEMRAFARMPRL